MSKAMSVFVSLLYERRCECHCVYHCEHLCEYLWEHLHYATILIKAQDIVPMLRRCTTKTMTLAHSKSTVPATPHDYIALTTSL